ncbi:HemK family protein methyltransferase [Candidatus Gracilibacteria bacterium]|nr:HemK family protein methyltransferase [Candidatus Gracilibacteria bacterium]
MKKQEYFDMGISAGLSFKQIESILCKILELSPTQLFSKSDISAAYIYEAQKLFFDVASGVPEEYSTENANFYGRDFFVDERVLIPRNDTEILVRQSLLKLNTGIDVASTVYADIGTGSGCIAISILQEMLPMKFHSSFAFDISASAREVATINKATYELESLNIEESNLLKYFFNSSNISKRNLFLTANLPYIKDGDVENMESSVIEYEPDGALYGGRDTGFELYEKLIVQCFQLKELQKIKNIYLCIEIGFDQYDVSRQYLEDMGLSFEYFQDSASIQRVIYISGF